MNKMVLRRPGAPGWGVAGPTLVKILAYFAAHRLRLLIAYFRACAGIGYTRKSCVLELVDSKIPFVQL